MTERVRPWRADPYQSGNSGQLLTALEALMLAGAHLHSGGRFADVGCGSGELAQAMAARNFEVVGNDYSLSMVEAAKQRCAGLPAEFDVQDAHELSLPENSFQVVHSSWMIHWLSDAATAVRAMARATTPGGLVVLQWSCAQPRKDGFALRDVVNSVIARPAWEQRLADTPFSTYQHPHDEVAALLKAEGLDILHVETDVQAQEGNGDPEALRRGLKAAAFHTQAEVLGDDADKFIDEVIHALLDGGALNPHNARIIARRPGITQAAVRRFPLSVGHLEVESTEDISPLMRRINFRVDAPQLEPLQPAETITLIWPAEDANEVVLPETGRWRFPAHAGRQHTANLTIRELNGDRLTADFFLHGEHGQMSRWAAKAKPGDRIGFGGSRVHWVPDPTADWVLFAGDETALPSIAAIAETLPDGRRAIAVIEVRDEAERIELANVEAHWIFRRDREPGTTNEIEETVRALEFPEGRAQVWGGGESLLIQGLRRHLVSDRGLARDQVCVLGYWNRPKGETQ
ncbi:SIP domain-containing protein [Lentzea sp. NPDC051838]|uniref:SIP domain-containing protein n=1 Tax=Lentzea sp. NPDC051838 TaxID=3154849 RepID=UPI003424FD42